MPASLTHTLRSDLLTALPSGAAGADPTDDDILRAVVTTLATLRAMLADMRAVAPAAQAPAAEPDPTPILRALAGHAPADAPAWSRRAVEEAVALRRSADRAAAELAEARRAAASVDKARDLVARAVHAAATGGRVPDDLPPALRQVVQEVIDLRAELERVQAQAEEAAARAQAPRSIAGPDLVRERAEWRKQKDSYEREIKALEKQIRELQRAHDASQRARDLVEAEASHRIREVEEARAMVALAAGALGLPPDASAVDVAAALEDRLGVQRRPATPAPTARERKRKSPPTPIAAPPAPPPPEPPMMHEVAWADLRPGDLALDRAAYRDLRAVSQAAARSEGPYPTDQQRRVLAHRAGDRVVWLRGDGLHADGVTPADAPAHRAGRDLRDASSPRALVIAEEVADAPAAVEGAWQDWLRSADRAQCLAAALDDSPRQEDDERQDMLPSSATSAATIRTGGGL